MNICRNEMEGIRPELGLFLPPKSTGSWFLRSCKMHLRLFENPASEPQIDLDTLSGPTEVSLEIAERSGVKYIAKFGVSIVPSLNSVVPSQTITIAPRHVVLNESEENITVRQCNLEVDTAGMISINSRQSAALLLQEEIGKRAEYSLFENIIKKHRHDFDSSLIYIQFRLNESQLDWSGPLCITSLGRFFLKFRKHSSQLTAEDKKIAEFAEVHVVEEGSTIVVHFQKPPSSKLPYRIENYLHGASLTYYQKNSSESEFLGSECVVDYTWDDVTLPRKLVVILNDMNLPREINLDKVRTWKPFYKLTQERLASQILFDKKSKGKRSRFGEHQGMNAVRVGYEVYADGPTRVLRICEFSDSHKQDKAFHSCAKIRMRVSQFAIQLLEKAKEDLNQSGTLCYTPFAVARLHNISLDSLFTDQQKYNQIAVQSLTVDVKWMGAPVASMLRRHRLDDSDANDSILKIIFVLLSAGSDVKQVKYSSVILQPIDLNIDEDTLMKIVSFWRTSLSDSNSPSQQFYFDNFEIHPIKIIATFVPGESYSSYNSAQEALRTLLHSVVKVPPIKKVAVELNGVSVTHALVTIRELYAMRSISIAKGSQLLPPAFASIFDDLASSSLDIFFDPSQGLMNLPGFKWGTFKFISRCIDGKGFSGTKRYFGDLGKTLKTAGSNVIFAAVTEISDSVLKGAEASGFNGMVSGFHQGILKLAMEPSVLGTALMGSGPDRKIKLDRSPGVDELYIEGYLQAMLDSMYRQEYLRVRVVDDQVFLKNLPPNSSLINEIMDSVKGFLISKALLKGDPSTASRPFRNVQGESEWRIGPTIITLCEHLFVSFAIRKLRSQADKYITIIKSKKEAEKDEAKEIVPADTGEVQKVRFIWKWGIAKFVLSGILAYIDGRLCRSIPNPVARRIVSGFLLSFLDQNN
ncbi:Vacuolar protein sorting-associated protein 13b [Gossypium australe]|uniref:Vacuolar protein sorting-associated protein 13b n=1 Tax=Gossypium australe TaxID=47621 RepID=A0A5B6VZ03_9ROSI|nr:Vacuolar protein sorting-associated protein 13b [Gossypium australe]